jgi:hypothetical protein
MAPRRSNKKPNKKPLPNLDELLNQIREEDGNIGEDPETLSKIDALLNNNEQKEQPLVKKQKVPKIKVPKIKVPSFLSLGSNKDNNCCNCCDDMLGMLNIINDSVSKILSALKAESLLDKKKTDEIRKNQEEQERKEKENLLESSGRKLSRTFQQAFVPIKSAMDAIFKFILFTLAGRAIGKILKWFADPANEKKVKSLTRFLKDWWPALLGAFVLFGTKFGGAIRASIGAVISTVLYLRKIGIPGILAGLKSLGIKGLAFGALAGAGILGYKLLTKADEGSTQESSKTPNKGGDAPTSPSGTQKFSNGGIVRGINFLLPEEKHVSEIGYAEGGHIDEASGIAITGAGPDTQLIAAQPGEVVMSKAAVDKFGADTFLRMNLQAGSSNQPKFTNNIQFAKEGGLVGGIMSGIKSAGSNMMKGMPQFGKPAKAINSYTEPTNSPKISDSDFNTLLAIASAEDSDPQGRADVAQSIYNRLFAGSSAYGLNFMPTGRRNTIKDIITGKGQYEPTFKNRNDWLSINDRKSAAFALANSKKIDISSAMQMLNETEKALRNSQLQMNAQQHVGGRPSFFGTSQLKHMKGDDALRYDMVNGKKVPRKDNFFTNYPAENTKYHKERGTVAAPIPSMLYSQPGNEQSFIPRNNLQPGNGQSSLPRTSLQLSSMVPTVRAPGPRSAGKVTITELPPINLKKQGPKGGTSASTDVPDFSAIPPYSDRYGDNGTLATLGIRAGNMA